MMALDAALHRLTDGNGNCDELAFSRPGFRILADASVNDARAAAWRTKPPV